MARQTEDKSRQVFGLDSVTQSEVTDFMDATNKAIRVNQVTGGSSSSGAQVSADNTAFTAGDSNGANTAFLVDDTSPSMVSEGRVGTARMTSRRAIHVQPRNNNADASLFPDSVAMADGLTNPTTTLIGSAGLHFNDSTWDRNRGNREVTLLSSASRTAQTFSGDNTNYDGRGMHLVLNVSDAGGGGAVQVTLQGKAPDGSYYDVLVGANVAANGITVYKVYPGMTPSANSVANDVLPRTFRIRVDHNNANAITYAVSGVVVK